MFLRVQSEAKKETADPVEVKPVANDGAFVPHQQPGPEEVGPSYRPTNGQAAHHSIE